jgi:hypothetical protein
MKHAADATYVSAIDIATHIYLDSGYNLSVMLALQSRLRGIRSKAVLLEDSDQVTAKNELTTSRQLR